MTGRVLVAVLALAGTSALADRVTVRPTATHDALVNPGMGWVYYHYDDSNWNYGAETAPGDTLDWFPGASVAYFRLPWRDLEPEEGVYRWDVIDSVAQPWIAAGKQVAFRFTCTESSYEWGVPEWLPAAGCKGAYMMMAKDPKKPGFRLWEPVWDDPVFLEKYGNFLAAAARRWNGNPSVAFIDVGSFGMWGEGHTGFTSKIPAERSRELAILHAKLLKRHFPDVPVVISDDVGGGWNKAEDSLCMKTLREMGVGFRDDSIMVAAKPNQWFHGGWARKFAAAGLPVVVESRHFFADRDRDRWYEGGLYDSTVEYQASFQGIHWWPREFLAHNRAEVDRINLRLGYRFELRTADWPREAKVGERIEIGSTWVNVGVAASREELVAAWTLTDAKGTVVWTSVDEGFDFRGLRPTLEDGEHPETVKSSVRFGWDWPACGVYHQAGNPEVRHDGSVRRHGPRVPTIAPGEYEVCVSVGRRDGTPRIALPLASQLGKTRRYRLGRLVLRPSEPEAVAAPKPPAAASDRLSDAERQSVVKALGAVPESPARNERESGRRMGLWNYVPRPEKLMTQLKPLGNMPFKPSAEIADSPLGIGFETLDRDTFDPQKTFPFLKDSGVKWARCQTGWMKCEKTPGTYDFAWLDEVVDGLSAIGIRTWFSVSFGHPHYTPNADYERQWAEARQNGTVVPGWARGWVRETPYYHGPEAMEGWRRYCKALARHFKGRVRVWEVWNEPEWFWWHQGKSMAHELGFRQAAKDYCDFLRFTVTAIREEIPDAQFSFNLASLASGWIHVLKDEGVCELVDIFGYHGYDNTPESGLREMIDMARAAFRKADGTPLRIWQAESGRASGPSALFSLPSEYAQAKFVARRILSDLHEGAEVTSIFTVTDFLKYYPDGRDQFYGLINARENRPKLGFATLQGLGWLCDGLERAPDQFLRFGSYHEREFRAERDFAAVAVASFRRRGVPVFAFWQREHLEMSAAPLYGTLTLSLPACENALPDPILIDLVRGKVWDAKAYRSFDNIRGKMNFTGIHAFDCPFVLTDLSLFRELIR